MQTRGVLVGDIGVRAFDPPGEVRTNEQIEDSIHAIRRHAAIQAFRDFLGDIVSARGFFEVCQCVEHRGPHIGPLLALFHQPVASRYLQGFALVELVIVLRHVRYSGEIDLGRAYDKESEGRLLRQHVQAVREREH
jgi:hypothetical protein